MYLSNPSQIPRSIPSRQRQTNSSCYLPSQYIVEEDHKQHQQQPQPPPQQQQQTVKQKGRFARGRKSISKKVVSVLLTSKLLQRYKRLHQTSDTVTLLKNTGTIPTSISFSLPSETQEDCTLSTSAKFTSIQDQPTTVDTDWVYFPTDWTFLPARTAITNERMSLSAASLLCKRMTPKWMNVKGEENDGVVSKFAPVWVWIAAAFAITITLLTNFSYKALLLDIITAMTFIFSPYVVYQKTILAQLGSLRQNYNAIRESTNVFHLENNKLTQNIDDLEAQTTALSHVKDDLQKLVGDTTNLDRLVAVVKEMKETNDEIEKHLHAEIIHDIIKTVLTCDRDGDLMLSQKEMNKLSLRLVYNPAFVFNEAAFKKILGKPNEKNSYKIGRVLDVIRNITDDDVTEEEKVFLIKKPGKEYTTV